jgi:hypothetical protein
MTRRNAVKEVSNSCGWDVRAGKGVLAAETDKVLIFHKQFLGEKLFEFSKTRISGFKKVSRRFQPSAIQHTLGISERSR